MPKPATGNKRINVMIDPRVLQILKILAKRRNTTYSDLIRIATARYAKEEGAKLKAEIGAAAPTEG